MTLTAEQLLQDAVQHFQSGNLAAARSACQRLIQSDAQHATACQLLGLIEHAAGEYPAAAQALRRSVQLVSDQPPWHFNLGVSLREAGDTPAAIAAYQRAIELDPAYAVAHHNLGTAWLDEGRIDDAIAALQHAITLHRGRAGWWSSLGAALLAAARADDAIKAYQNAVELDPAVADHHAGLGDAYIAVSQPPAARRAYQAALEIEPNNADHIQRLGLARRESGNAGEAERLFRKVLQITPDDPQVLRHLAMVLRDTGRLDEAHETISKAIAAEPDHPDLITVRASLLNRQGRAQEAAALIEPLLAQEHYPINAVIEYALVARSSAQRALALAKAEAALQRPGIQPAQQSLLHFAAAKLLDREQQYDAAFDHAKQGNALRHRRLKRQQTTQTFDDRIAAFSPDLFASYAKARQTREPGRRMVFVVGMLRSGTTLVEQIIAAHPCAIGVGESPWLAQVAHDLPKSLGTSGPYAQGLSRLTPDAADRFSRAYLDHVIPAGSDAQRVVDKMPGNFMDVGLIALLFPEARIIHCQRDPRDVCLSCYFHHFGGSHPYAYDLSDLGFYHRQYDRLMAHWHTLLGDRILPVVYEEVTQDLEGQSRRLIEFLGLPWDDRCLRFHEQDSAVVTSSFEQVRQPIYQSSVGKWQRYAHRLGPLLEALGMPQDVSTEAVSVGRGSKNRAGHHTNSFIGTAQR